MTMDLAWPEAFAGSWRTWAGLGSAGHRETGGRVRLSPGRGEIDGHQVIMEHRGAKFGRNFDIMTQLGLRGVA